MDRDILVRENIFKNGTFICGGKEREKMSPKRREEQ